MCVSVWVLLFPGKLSFMSLIYPLKMDRIWWISLGRWADRIPGEKGCGEAGLVLSVFSSLGAFFTRLWPALCPGGACFCWVPGSSHHFCSLLQMGLVPASHCGWSLVSLPLLLGSSTLHAHSWLSIQCLLKKPLRCFFSWQDSDGNSQKYVGPCLGKEMWVWAGLIPEGWELETTRDRDLCWIYKVRKALKVIIIIFSPLSWEKWVRAVC